jgi:methyltransferase (TIGR00027 family)
MSPEEREKAFASQLDIVDAILMRSPAFANVITRTRFAEDALEVAVANGIKQYVLIGAGFDSFSLRRPHFAEDLEIFEIDHPATQSLKLQRIKACEFELSDKVHFIAADLSQVSVAGALAGSSYRQDSLSFFSWLGVTMYLSLEANFSTFKSIATCAPKRSQLAFTYMEERTLRSNSPAFQAIQRRVSAVGEPFVSGFDPVTLPEQLRTCGLTLIEDMDGEQAASRWDANGGRRFDRHSSSHLALAQVGALEST